MVVGGWSWEKTFYFHIRVEIRRRLDPPSAKVYQIRLLLVKQKKRRLLLLDRD
jgi:hypothetical protein